MIKQIIAAASIALLAGCGGTREPQVTTTTITGTDVLLDCPEEAATTGVVAITLTDADLDSFVRSEVVNARRSKGWGGLFTVGDQTTAGTTKSATYVVTTQEKVMSYTAGDIPFSITNTSNRAFDVAGIVIRAKSDNPAYEFKYPEDVTNKKRLAPGESITGQLKVLNLQKAQTGDSISLSFYEVPEQIAADGSISKRTSKTINITITTEVKPFECKRTTADHRVSWTGSSPEHPAYAKFIRK